MTERNKLRTNLEQTNILLENNIKQLTINLDLIRRLQMKLNANCKKEEILIQTNISKQKTCAIFKITKKKNIFLCRKVNRNASTNESNSISNESVNKGVIKNDDHRVVNISTNGLIESTSYFKKEKDAASFYDYCSIKNITDRKKCDYTHNVIL